MTHSREYMRKYRSEHRERTLEIARESRRRRRGDWKTRARDCANNAVARAIRKGTMAREACGCGNPKSEAHHDSYRPEKRKAVRWLCHDCHVSWHMENQPEWPDAPVDNSP